MSWIVRCAGGVGPWRGGRVSGRVPHSDLNGLHVFGVRYGRLCVAVAGEIVAFVHDLMVCIGKETPD